MKKEQDEGKVAKEIEKHTAKIPSDVYLWTAASAMGISLIFKFVKKDELSLFIGQWSAPLLLMGVYNKIVKTEGSD